MNDQENREAARVRATKHGMHGTKTYKSWEGMIARCTNPNRENWTDYGGRGITVCDKWKSFTGFFSDMGLRPDGMSIERIDNDLGYFPENCRWAVRSIQQNNKRTNVFVTYKGRTQTVQMWAREIGIHQRIISGRLNYGWTPEKAMETPVSRSNKRHRNYQETSVKTADALDRLPGRIENPSSFTREEILLLKVSEHVLCLGMLDNAVRALLRSAHDTGRSKYQRLVLSSCLDELEKRANDAMAIKWPDLPSPTAKGGGQRE